MLAKKWSLKVKVIICLGALLTCLIYPFSQTDADETGSGGILKIGVFNEIEGLNPFTIYSSSAYEVMRLNYNLLVTVDESVEPAPDLAESWSSNPEGTVWTFNLRQDVKWQDGEAFTAADVKFTFEYIRDNELGYFYDSVVNMEDISTPDEHTVVITFSAPAAYMPQFVVPIVPKHIWQDIDPNEANSTFANDNPIGTGPFKVVEFKKGEFTRMEVNKDYFKGAPAIDGVIFIIFANASTAAEALKLGEVDIVTKMPAAQFKALQDQEGIVTIDGSSPGFTEMAINSWSDPASKGNPLLKDKNIRQAMACAVDKQYLLDAANLGYGELGSTIVPPTYKFWHYEPTGSEVFNFDLERAAKILDDAGYVDSNGDGIRESAAGEKLDFRLTLRSEDPSQIKCGRLIAEWFKEIGIGTTIDVVDSGTLTDRIYDNGDYDMFIWTYYMDPDPSSILRVMTSGQILSWNDSFYSNAEFDALFLEQEQQIDRDQRKQTIDEMQKMVYEDCPYIVLFYGPELEAYRTDKFAGWTATPDDSVTIMTHNILTYENMQPADMAPQGTGSKGGGSIIWWIVGIIVVAGGAFVVLKKRKKKVVEEEDF